MAFALLLYGAQRSGDVRYLEHEMIATGHIQLDQSKTSNAVSVRIIEPLQDVLAAGPLGTTTLLETKTGEIFTPKGFYGMMKRACIDAGLPHCSPHGLRKSAARRCKKAKCTNEEGMAITGHKSVREYLRYAGDDHSDEADAAMDKVMANLTEKVANRNAQAIEKAVK